MLGTRISPNSCNRVDYTPHAYLLGIRCRIHCEYTQNIRGFIVQSHIAMIIPDCAPELQPSPILRSMRRSNIQVNQLYVTEEHNVLEVTEVTPQAVTVRPWTEIVTLSKGCSQLHLTKSDITYSSSVQSLRVVLLHMIPLNHQMDHALLSSVGCDRSSFLITWTVENSLVLTSQCILMGDFRINLFRRIFSSALSNRIQNTSLVEPSYLIALPKRHQRRFASRYLTGLFLSLPLRP